MRFCEATLIATAGTDHHFHSHDQLANHTCTRGSENPVHMLHCEDVAKQHHARQGLSKGSAR